MPDPTRLFTLTMRNAADGADYVVAHYEPGALSWGSSQKASLLCEVRREGQHTDRANRLCCAGVAVVATNQHTHKESRVY